MPTIFISAGEASGELYGAQLASLLRQKLPQAELIGMGGERMRAAGVQCVVRAEDMAVMGFTEVVEHLPRIYGEFRKLRRAIRELRPQVAVLVDFPDFHFRLFREFHRLGIPVIYFVSPQLWAWKKHRIKQVQKYVRRMLVIFPFEEQFYRDRGVNAEFVGHPLAQLPPPFISREEFAAIHHLDPSLTWIALLPGSRMREIRDHLPTMLHAAHLLAQSQPSLRFEFLIPLAPTLHADQRTQVASLISAHAGQLSARLISGEARAALFHARASVVASGTATVEAALIGNPFVVVYRVSPLTYAIAKRVVSVPHVAMANLIAARRLVPELIQHDFTAQNIVEHLQSLLPDGAPRESMIQGLGEVREALTPNSTSNQTLSKHQAGERDAIERLAAVVIEELGSTVPAIQTPGRT
ncbi:MAG: lipid-A-disaccharide synthase [Terracidiphilus sp.]|jgi:lipid-A-disaccharide synthase